MAMEPAERRRRRRRRTARSVPLPAGRFLATPAPLAGFGKDRCANPSPFPFQGFPLGCWGLLSRPIPGDAWERRYGTTHPIAVS
eukprot:SM000076S21830  [mRNA]  locus=s76:423488:423739:+ [translate_table: standard]